MTKDNEASPAFLHRMTQTLVEALIAKDDPHEVLMALLKTYTETDLEGNDLIKIMAGALILMAKANARAGFAAYGVVIQLLSILYADRNLEQLNVIARDVLTARTPMDWPEIHVVVMRHHED